MRSWLVILYSIFVAAFLTQEAWAAGAGPEALSATSRRHLSVGWFDGTDPPGGLVDNAAFMPAADAGAALHRFEGALTIPEFVLASSPARIHDGLLLGRDPQRFPAVTLGFVAVDGELLPQDRGIVAATGGNSYWDLIADPGRVWSEPGDGGRSRASFPFVLMNRVEGESYNGIASFVFDSTRASRIAVQIVQQTSPYLITRRFVAWGAAPVRYEPRPIPEQQALIADRAQERSVELRLTPWQALASRAPDVDLAAFSSPDRDPNAVLLALVDGDTVYSDGCRSAAGAFPYCERMRHGVWSVTKALVGGTALMRLAAKYGDEVYARRVTDLLDAGAGRERWRDVTLEDAANMATGIGSGNQLAEPNDINSGYLDDRAAYERWYLAPTLEARFAETFAERAYPWGPGKVARYRDQDPLVLAAAMQSLLERHEGRSANLWTTLVDEVYRPLGIPQLVQASVPAEHGAKAVPIAGYGAYPTLGDMVQVARLLLAGGRWNGEQILSASAIARFMPLDRSAGFATGELNAAGETRYLHYFWHIPFRSDDCTANIAQMSGWGGNVVAMFPNGMIGIRVAHDGEGEDWKPLALAELAHRLRPFCAAGLER